MSPNSNLKIPIKKSITWIIPEKLEQNKKSIFIKLKNELSNYFIIEIHTLTNAELKLSYLTEVWRGKTNYIFLPNYLYFHPQWALLEPQLAQKAIAYYTELEQIKKLPDPGAVSQRIILDLLHLSATEVLFFLDRNSILLFQTLEEGPGNLFRESWESPHGQEKRVQTLMELPKLVHSRFISKSQPIHSLLFALWRLSYEELRIAESRAKFYLNIEADSLLLRLRLPAVFNSKETFLKKFWTEISRDFSASQLLVRYSDFLCLLWKQDQSELEVICGLLSSAPLQLNPSCLHTLWIDGDFKPAESKTQTPKIQALTHSKDNVFRLKSALRKPTNELLYPYQKRYFETKFEIQNLEKIIYNLEKNNSKPEKLSQKQREEISEEINDLMLRIDAIANRLHTWVKQLIPEVRKIKK